MYIIRGRRLALNPQLFHRRLKWPNQCGSVYERNQALHHKYVYIYSFTCNCPHLARGLDIPSIHNVINYEVARDIDTHTHRIGRTGRAGIKGTAHTLFVAGKDPVDFAACLVQHLEAANQVIPERLRQLANSCSWFAHNRASLETLGQAHVFGSARPSSGFEPRPPKVRRGLGLSTTDDDETVRSGPAAAAAAGEGAELVRPGGLQADRFAAMKSAFSAQYNRRFVSAGVEATRYTHPETLKQTHDQKPAAEPLPIPTGDTDVHEEPPQQKQPSPQKFQLQWREVVPVETAVSHQPSHAEPTTESPIKKRRSRWDWSRLWSMCICVYRFWTDTCLVSLLTARACVNLCVNYIHADSARFVSFNALCCCSDSPLGVHSRDRLC